MVSKIESIKESTRPRIWLLKGARKRGREMEGREKKETKFLKLFDCIVYII